MERLPVLLLQSYHWWGGILIFSALILLALLFLRHNSALRTTETCLQELVHGFWGITGEEFFHSFGHHLSRALAMEHVLIGRFHADRLDQVESVVFYSRGEIQRNFIYSLPGSPCEDLLGKGICTYASKVGQLFPEDLFLRALGVESFVGTPLLDSSGRARGLLAVFGGRTLKNPNFAESLLQVFAARAAGELERQQFQENFQEHSGMLQTILNAIPAPIFYKDLKGIYIGCNLAFETLLGLPREEIIGKDVFAVAPGDLAEIYFEADQALFRQGGTQTYETSVVQVDGSRREVLFHKAVFGKADGTIGGMVGVMVDITERKEAEKTIKYLASFDPLTNLPNQVLFTDRLNLEIAHSHRRNQKFAVFNLDLDHFMKINNAFGHSKGDELLREVGQRLSGCVREDDTVSKMGGDSFTLILPNIHQEEHAAKIAGKILETFRHPFELEGQEIFISVSIGIAIFPHDGIESRTLLRNAGTALFRAKEKGRNNFQFYTPAMNVRSRELLSLENDLRRALDRKELVLEYQPLIDTMTGDILGAEALIRWKHPTRGLIYPNQFISLAEGTGLIVPIGAWVLEQVCNQARTWQEKGLPPLRLAANLSPRQFQEPGLFGKIDRILTEAGVAPFCLSLEITENAIMEDLDHTVETLVRLKNLGLHLAIDDFGTGYSSLTYLKRFPIDMIKIDRSFITEIPEAVDDMAIVSAVTAMAHNLNIKVLAEGVENEKQKDFLCFHQCDEMQGYFFSPPLAASDFQSLVQKWSGSRLSIFRPVGNN